MVLAALGPSLPDFEISTNTTVEAQSTVFSARAAGYMLGSAIGGPLVDRYPGHYLMFGSLLACAASTGALPLVGSVWTEGLLVLPAGISMGVLDTVGNVLLIYLIRDGVEPYMQTMHFAFAVGAFLSPVLIRLAHDFLGSIWPAWWLFALVFIPFAISLIFYRSPSDPSRHEAQAQAQSSEASFHRTFIIAGTAAFLGFYVGAEVAAGGLVSSYILIRDLADRDIAYITPSFFWGALAVWRGLAVPISMRLSPSAMLFLNLLGCVTSTVALVILRDNLVGVWICILVFGSAMASSFPTTINLAESYIDVTGKAASLFVVGASTGEFVIPWALGALLLPTQGLSFVYGLLAASVMMVIVLVLLVMKGNSRPKQKEAKDKARSVEMGPIATPTDSQANGHDHSSDDEQMVSLDAMAEMNGGTGSVRGRRGQKSLTLEHETGLHLPAPAVLLPTDGHVAI